MSRIRTFIAIESSAEVRDRLSSVLNHLAATIPAIRWVQPKNLHLTLKFLGDVEDTEIYQVCQVVAAAAEARSPFELQCQGLGAFPSLDRPRTIWAGIQDPSGQLAPLQETIEQGIGKLGFPRELRQFRPHLTLGRARTGRRNLTDLAQSMQKKQDATFGGIPVHEIVVMGSELTPEGPEYTVMGRLPLEG